MAELVLPLLAVCLLGVVVVLINRPVRDEDGQVVVIPDRVAPTEPKPVETPVETKVPDFDWPAFGRYRLRPYDWRIDD